MRMDLVECSGASDADSREAAAYLLTGGETYRRHQVALFGLRLLHPIHRFACGAALRGRRPSRCLASVCIV